MSDNENGKPEPLRGVSYLGLGLQDPDKTWAEPTFNQVLLRDIRQKKTEGTQGAPVDLPDCANDPLPKARVVAVGPGRLLHDGSLRPLDLRPGDIVTIGMPVDKAVTINGEVFGLTVDTNCCLVLHNVDLSNCKEGASPLEVKEEQDREARLASLAKGPGTKRGRFQS